MRIYDISREVFASSVYPGDPAPKKHPLESVGDGSMYNLTEITLGSHSGTHIDAPRHFYDDGRTVDKLELAKCVGACKLVRAKGKLSPDWVEKTLSDGTVRLLISGDIEISPEAACAMTASGLGFLGVEGLTVGSEHTSADVHLELLKHETVILENCDLSNVPEGKYFLVSAPVKYGGLDGAQARPLIIDFSNAEQ